MSHKIPIKDVLYIVACIIWFSAGLVLGKEISCTTKRNPMESEDFKVSIILGQQIALEYATKVILNNDLLEKDKSRDMTEFIRVYHKVDSLWNTIP